MTAPGAHLELAGDFPPASREQWRSLVAAVLAKSGMHPQDGSPEDALSYPTYDGLRISPLYTADDLPDGFDPSALPGEPPYVRGTSADRPAWDVRQRVSDPEPDAANAAVLAELAGGASSIWLQLGQGGAPVESLAAVLDGMYLELAPVALDAGAETEAAAEALLRLVNARGLAPGEVAGTLGADPIGHAARTGTAPDLGLLTRLAGAVADYPQLLPATVDATVYSEAGGSDSDELAISVAVGVAYLRALTEAGLGIDAALAQLEFRYAVSADQWASMAKLRAGRRLWNRVAELCEAPAASQRQHAVTAAVTLTRRDPWVNLLRATVGCFAAAVAGAEAITVAPFDSALGLPDDFGRRIARNTQSILHDESSLARVLDPGGGSWYLESLTEQLAEVAWNKFTAIERAGGAVAALESGELAGMLAASWQTRRNNIARRRDPITGVSEFAMPAETPLSRPQPAVQAAPPGALPRIRYAEPFEALRDRSDARLAAAGARPQVFLAAFGPAPARAARLGFAANLLAAGGIEAVVGTGEPAELVAAFQAAGTGVAVLCSSDAEYSERAGALAADLTAAGATQVWIAGPPALVGTGIHGAVYTGCDAVAALEAMFEALGVAS
jgi:methylmalonyl-CoA mutase